MNVKKMHKQCENLWSSKSMLVDSGPYFNVYSGKNEGRFGWKNYVISYYFRASFSNSPLLFFSICNEKTEVIEYIELNSFDSNCIIKAIVEKVLNVFAELDWRQQREIIIEIGHKLREVLLKFDDGKLTNSQIPGFKISIVDDYSVLEDNISIEDLIENHTSKTIRMI